MQNEPQGNANNTFTWPTAAWLAAALGLPAIVGAIAKGFAEQHVLLIVVLVAVYWAVLAVARFASGVTSDLAERWRPRFVERVDGALIARLSRSEQGYRRWVMHRLKKVDLQGLPTVPNAVPGFDQIYIDVSLVNRPPHQISGDLLSDRLVNSAERQSISALLREARPVVLAILGAPGSGKTTLLRQAARQACRRKLGRRRVPILLSLRDHAPAIAADPSLPLPARAVPPGLDRPPPQSWFETCLRRGRCIVLLDGLDEVGQPAQREAVVKWVDEQISSYPRNHFVLTSRRHGYTAAAINSADVLQVRQLTALQIVQFIDNWYAAVEPDRLRAKAHARDLREQVKANAALDAMSVNPLLLTMIVNVHRERGVLPANRVELYREICEVLLFRRRAVKGLSSAVSGSDKQNMLQTLALHMMVDRVRELPSDQVIALIEPAVARLGNEVDPRQLLTELVNDGILVEPETGAIGFCHKTFQEYLASVEIYNLKCIDILVANIEDDWWRETTILYAAKYDADIVIHACLASQTVAALELAFDCHEHGTRMAPSLRAQMNDLLAELHRPGTTTVRRQILTRVVLRRFLRHSAKMGDGRRATDPVTAELYRLFLADEKERGYVRTPDAPFPDRDDVPVAGVRYEDANAFVAWVNEYAGGAIYRLPCLPEAAEINTRGLLGDPAPPVWIACECPPWDEPHAMPYIRWTPSGPDHPYRIDAEMVEQYLCRDIYLATLLILEGCSASSEQQRGRRPAANHLRALYYSDLRTDQGRCHTPVLFGPLSQHLGQALTRAFAHELASALSGMRTSIGRLRSRQLSALSRDLTDQVGVRITPDICTEGIDLDGAAEVGSRLAAAHDYSEESVGDLLAAAARQPKNWVLATPLRLRREGISPLRGRTVTPTLINSIGTPELDYACGATFDEASLEWMRDLGKELTASVAAAFDREFHLSPIIATVFRLTALCLASESDVRRGPRTIRAACQKIVLAITILERRLNGSAPPNEIIVLIRE